MESSVVASFERFKLLICPGRVYSVSESRMVWCLTRVIPPNQTFASRSNTGVCVIRLVQLSSVCIAHCCTCLFRIRTCGKHTIWFVFTFRQLSRSELNVLVLDIDMNMDRCFSAFSIACLIEEKRFYDCVYCIFHVHIRRTIVELLWHTKEYRFVEHRKKKQPPLPPPTTTIEASKWHTRKAKNTTIIVHVRHMKTKRTRRKRTAT